MGVTAAAEAEEIVAEAIDADPGALFCVKCWSTWVNGVPEGQHGIKFDSQYFVG